VKYKVIFDVLADSDLENIFNYVADNDSYSTAYAFISEIENLCGKLESFPERGHIIPELKAQSPVRYLELHYKTYRIIYELKEHSVYIHAVIDGRRNVAEALSKRNLRVI